VVVELTEVVAAAVRQRQPELELLVGEQWTPSSRRGGNPELVRGCENGSDGTRTRDLRRDRPVMALPG
jgi:hypothetical protein